MTKVEKILIGIVLILGLTVQVMGLFDIRGGVFLLLATYTSLTVLTIYYMTRIKLSIYTVIFGLIIIVHVRIIFKFQHWPYQEILSILGPLWALIFSGVLLWTIFKCKLGKDSIYLYIIISVLLTNVILDSIGNQELIYYDLILNYLLVAAIGTMKLTDLKIQIGINKILNIILIQGILIIVSHTINMII